MSRGTHASTFCGACTDARRPGNSKAQCLHMWHAKLLDHVVMMCVRLRQAAAQADCAAVRLQGVGQDAAEPRHCAPCGRNVVRHQPPQHGREVHRQGSRDHDAQCELTRRVCQSLHSWSNVACVHLQAAKVQAAPSFSGLILVNHLQLPSLGDSWSH